MKKNDNLLKIDVFYLIASKEEHTHKLYYIDYEKLLKDLKYFVLLDYSVQIGKKKKEFYV